MLASHIPATIHRAAQIFDALKPTPCQKWCDLENLCMFTVWMNGNERLFGCAFQKMKRESQHHCWFSKTSLNATFGKSSSLNWWFVVRYEHFLSATAQELGRLAIWPSSLFDRFLMIR
jgi:hypothetical protein